MLMYAAAVFVVLTTGEPLVLYDTYGPYKTMEECKARSEDMFNFAMEKLASKSQTIKAGCKETWVGPREET